MGVYLIATISAILTTTNEGLPHARAGILQRLWCSFTFLGPLLPPLCPALVHLTPSGDMASSAGSLTERRLVHLLAEASAGIRHRSNRSGSHRT